MEAKSTLLTWEATVTEMIESGLYNDGLLVIKQVIRILLDTDIISKA